MSMDLNMEVLLGPKRKNGWRMLFEYRKKKAAKDSVRMTVNAQEGFWIHLDRVRHYCHTNNTLMTSVAFPRKEPPAPAHQVSAPTPI